MSVTVGHEDGPANCRGTHHSDYGQFGTCDGCHARVAKISDGRVANTHSAGQYGSLAYYCWSRHVCNPDAAAGVAAENALALAAGQVLKGATVEVVKGRKVPVGTVGVVFWTGEDSYGNAKVGLRTAEGDKHFTAESNVRAVVTPEMVAAAAAVEVARDAARQDTADAALAEFQQGWSMGGDTVAPENVPAMAIVCRRMAESRSPFDVGFRGAVLVANPAVAC